MRHIFSSFGGNLGETGSVSNYLYDYKGQLTLQTPGDFESFELALLDTEAEDYENGGERTTIWTDRTHLASVKKSLE